MAAVPSRCECQCEGVGGIAIRHGVGSPAMTRQTPPPKKDLFLIRSHSLTPSTADILMKFSIEATDSLGRPVSHSTIVRALLRYVDQQGSTWLQDQLFPIIKEEGSLARYRAERSELLQKTHDK
jgi:hypothetical protein